jgi:hypothetical protein
MDQSVVLRTVRPAALCRDIDRLVWAAGDPGTPTDVVFLRRWWTLVGGIVRHDIDGMAPSDAVEHHRLHTALDRIATVLTTLEDDSSTDPCDRDLLGAAMALRWLVRRHCGDGLCAAGTPLLIGKSAAEIAFEVPWLLDGLEDDWAETVLAALPIATPAGDRLAHIMWYRWITAPVRISLEQSRCLDTSPAAMV